MIPFRVKFIQGKKVAVEVKFVGYEFTREDAEITPDIQNWDCDVYTLFISYEGKYPERTVRNLIKKNYPEATTLDDLIGKAEQSSERFEEASEQDSKSNEPHTKKVRKQTQDQCVQTTTRIYTFPTPIPSLIARESVSWGEDEIKTAIMSTGELWHARFGHTSDPNMKATSQAYPMYDIPKKHVTNDKIQSSMCECCAKCKPMHWKMKSNHSLKLTRYLEQVHMDVC